MGRRGHGVAISALVAALTLPLRPAVAAPLSDTELAARGHYQAGTVYFQRGEYRRAVAAFLAAREQYDRPELDYNLGLAYERLGDAARALDAYERYLQRRPDADNRKEVETRTRALAALTGHITLEHQPVATRLLLDNEPIEVDGAGRLRATQGKHLLAVVRGEQHLEDREVRVSAGGVTRLALDRRPRSLWWVGVLVGGLAVAGLGVGLGVGLTRNNTEPAKEGTLGVHGVP
jgi:tetratricopeptide (TPR) repeat protein